MSILDSFRALPEARIFYETPILQRYHQMSVEPH